MVLVGAWIEAPDELSADFMRFFHIDDWTVLPMRRAASLCVAMIRQPESWTFRKIVPDWQWAIATNELLASVFDKLSEANWQRSKDGTKGTNRPKLYPRPGVPGYRSRFKKKALDVDMIRRELARPRVPLPQTP